jgi:putative transposase
LLQLQCGRLTTAKALSAINGSVAKVRQNKYQNNIVEQDHRAIKRIIKPMREFKDSGARIILAGIEVVHMIRKGQMRDERVAATTAEQFYSLAM